MPEAIASSNLRWYRLLKIYDLRTMAHDTKSNRNSVARKVTLSGTLANVDHKCRPDSQIEIARRSARAPIRF